MVEPTFAFPDAGGISVALAGKLSFTYAVAFIDSDDFPLITPTTSP